MPNTTRYVTARELHLVNLMDGSGSCTLDAGVLVLAENEPKMVAEKAMKVFTVQIGPHTSKKFVIDAHIFDEAFNPTS